MFVQGDEIREVITSSIFPNLNALHMMNLLKLGYVTEQVETLVFKQIEFAVHDLTLNLNSRQPRVQLVNERHPESMKELGELLAKKYSRLKKVKFDGCYSFYLLKDIFRGHQDGIKLSKIKLCHSMVLNSRNIIEILSQMSLSKPQGGNRITHLSLDANQASYSKLKDRVLRLILNPAKFPSLTHLSLRNNLITDSDGSLGKYLRLSQPLKKLVLSGTHLQDTSLKSLSEALSTH